MSEIGSNSLLLAFVVALAGAGAGIYGGITRREDWSRVAERSVWVVFAFVTLSMAALFWALATNQFELAYVAQHSARSMTLGYRLAALWGGQAGSLLLWCWMLTAYAAAAMWVNRRSNRTLLPWVASILLLNALFFLTLTNFVTRPFEMLPAAHVLSDGNGLNPLLQHPVMMIHPLMLYVGFVGFAVPFAFAFAALITGELGTTWFVTTRRWTLFAWTILGIGVVLGGRWAYEVLGWGGYWAWDPVENASFMPWLAATAYLHSVMIQEKRNMLKIWNLVLIGLTYSLCLFGTFLTRSGVVQSVHSFTNSGWFGYVFLGYLLVMALSFFLAVYLRRGELKSEDKLESMVSREAGFLLNNWAFMALLVIVFWGTLLPVISETVQGQRVTVGPVFFNTMAGPVSLFLLFLTGVGPLIAWRRASISSLKRQFFWPFVAMGIVAAASAALLWGELGLWVWGCWSLCAFVTASIVQEYSRAISARVKRNGESVLAAFRSLLQKNQRRYGGYIVHLGVVLIFIGFSGAAFNQERLENIAPGDSMTLRDYRLHYLTADPIPEQHYGGARARLALYHDEEPLAVMAPEKRIYWLEDQPASIPAVYSTYGEDLYVILTALEPDGSATIKLYYNPLVNWIWWGGFLYIAGCVAIMWPNPRPAGSASA